MKVWRNSEGREFRLVEDKSQHFADVPHPNGHDGISAFAMRELGYELVDAEQVSDSELEEAGRVQNPMSLGCPDGSVTATGAAEIPIGSDESERLRKLRELRERVGLFSGYAHTANLVDIVDVLIALDYSSEKGLGGTCPSVADPESDPEEFELECIVWKLGVPIHSMKILRDDRLIPGELYSVRKVKREKA